MRALLTLGLLAAASSVFLFGQPRAAATLTRHIGTYHGREVHYTVSNGLAVIEGDIQIGTVAEMASGTLAEAPRSFSANTTLWPNGVIPYTIDSTLPNQQRVLDAVDYWNTHTSLRIVPRTSETNYVRLTPVTFDAACSSAIGMRGGEQLLQVTSVCTSGNLIHEFGHAFSLLHEQQRPDRNAYLTVLYQNIDKRYTGDFDETLSGATMGGFFDFDSIMLYGPLGFTNNDLDSLETVPVGIPIGQRDHLSPGDIDWVSRLYGFTPTMTTITTTPIGLNITVDGARAVSPQQYNWAPGTTHTIAVDTLQGNDPRYAFALWSDNGTASHSITASASTTVYSAHFQRQHLVTWGVSSGSGSANVTPVHADGYYPERLQINVSETPGNDFSFVRWLGTTNFGANFQGVSTTNGVVDVSLPNASYQAQFSTAPITTITSDPIGRIVTVDGVSAYTPWNLLWTPGSSHTVSLSTPQLSGTNTARYNFQQWSDGSSSTTRTLTAGSESTTYSAQFQTQYLVTPETIGSGSVTLAPTSTDGFYNAGSTVQVTATPASGSSFRYWLVDLAGGNPTQTVTVNGERVVVATFGTGGQIPFRVLNAASFQGNPQFTHSGSVVSPGEIVTLFAGAGGLGPDTLAKGTLDANGNLATSVAGYRILFDTYAAPVIYASANQTSVIVPYELAGQTSTVVKIEVNGTITSTLSISVGLTAPALFTANSSGAGQIAALNQDYSVNSPGNAAAHGSVLQLFLTGEGMVTPGVKDGQFNTSALPKPNQPVYVRVGKLPATVLYAGAAPGQVAGLMQVNIQLPADLLPGTAIPIQISIGTQTSPPGTTIAVQ